MSLRLAWLHALARVDASGAHISPAAPLAAVLPPLACFGARAGKPRSLGSVLAACVARFLPHGNLVVLVVSSEQHPRSKYVLEFAARKLLKDMRDAGDVTVVRLWYHGLRDDMNPQLRSQLASARALVVLGDLSQDMWRLQCCLGVAEAACAVFVVGCHFLTGRRSLCLDYSGYPVFPYACPVFAFERVMRCGEIPHTWLWHAVTVLVQCGVADTPCELLAHYRRARSQRQTSPASLVWDLTPAQTEAVADFHALGDALFDVQDAIRAGRLRGGLPDGGAATVDDLDDTANEAHDCVSGALCGFTWIPLHVLRERVPFRELTRELKALVRQRRRFELEACLSRISTNAVLRHLRSARYVPRCISLSRDATAWICDDDFCTANLETSYLASALYFGLYQFSREDALRWLRVLALRCTRACEFDGVCYVLLQLSDAGAVVTRGSAHLDVSGPDYGFDTETWEPHGHALAVWLGAWHGYIVALPAAGGADEADDADAAPKRVTTQVSGADTLYFIPGAAAAVRVSTAAAARCDVVAEFFEEPPRGPPLQPLRARMADKVL
jgi:hypothetical protein